MNVDLLKTYYSRNGSITSQALIGVIPLPACVLGGKIIQARTFKGLVPTLNMTPFTVGA